MRAMRHWSVRHARFLEALYDTLESIFVRFDGVLGALGYERIERPVAALERVVKGFLFDCQMCGQCVLDSTGMSCPMNCPKTLRNGPCGGVRLDGTCEVKPDMRCVWVDAWEGSQRMRSGDEIRSVQVTIDHQLHGKSSWLREVRVKADARRGIGSEATP